MKLYTYFRSSAAFRVRIVLGLKGLPYESVPVHLLRDGGEQNQAAYRAVNPQGLVPTLVDGDVTLGQSLAICEYLEETHPTPPLLPQSAEDRAFVRSIASTIACDIHPLNNLRVLRYLKRDLGVTDEVKDTWYRHWVEEGLRGLEAQLQDRRTGRFCYGDTPTLADAFLVPQVFNAQRLACRLDPMPTVMRISDACMTIDAFARAAPAVQVDAE